MEALLGLLGGGLTRLVPEVISFFDKKNERVHEKEMLSLNIEADKLKAQNEMAIINAQAEAAMGSKDLDALIAGVQAQGQKTGIGIVDAINSLVRPVVTYWFLFLYSCFKAATLYLAIEGGVQFADAVVAMWGKEDMAVFASIISFWFVDRSLRKRTGSK